MGPHVGLLEGLDNAAELRTRILARSQNTDGLGDDHDAAHRYTTFGDAKSQSTGFNGAEVHLQLLREIYASTQKLANAN